MKKLLFLLLLPLLMGVGCTADDVEQNAKIQELENQLALLEAGELTDEPSEKIGTPEDNITDNIDTSDDAPNNSSNADALAQQQAADALAQQQAAADALAQQQAADALAQQQAADEAAELDRQIAEAEAENARLEEGIRVTSLINTQLANINSQMTTLGVEIQSIVDEYNAIGDLPILGSIIAGRQANLLEDTGYYSKLTLYDDLSAAYDELVLAKSAINNCINYNAQLDYTMRAVLSSYGISTSL